MFGDYAQWVATLSIEERRREQQDRDRAISAAKKGCAKCCGPVNSWQGAVPGGEPFKSGPYKNRYWCRDCWFLYWHNHPADLADEETREWVAEQAAVARLKKGGEVLMKDEEGAQVFLTDRGTVLISIANSPACTPNEFDAARFSTLLRVLQAIDTQNVPGFSLAPLRAPEPVTASVESP